MESSNILVLIMADDAHNLCVDRSDAYMYKKVEKFMQVFAHKLGPCSETVVWLEIIFPRSSKG